MTLNFDYPASNPITAGIIGVCWQGLFSEMLQAKPRALSMLAIILPIPLYPSLWKEVLLVTLGDCCSEERHHATTFSLLSNVDFICAEEV